MALLAYRAAYDSHPSIELYRRIKKLSGLNLENLRPALLKKAREMHYSDVLVDIHLEENEWDEAIRLAQRDIFSSQLNLPAIIVSLVGFIENSDPYNYCFH
jgi:hypothetical protein